MFHYIYLSSCQSKPVCLWSTKVDINIHTMKSQIAKKKKKKDCKSDIFKVIIHYEGE